jgi:hypothetical protein
LTASTSNELTAALIMSTTIGGPFQPGHHTRVTLSATQLKWLQETQNNIDLAISHYEKRVGNDLVARLHKIQSGDDRCTWDWFIGCRGKVEAEANDLHIPEWVVPNVKAIWDAERNYLEKGMSLSSMPLLLNLMPLVLNLTLIDVIDDLCMKKGPVWFV